jgi:cystathionine gamma-synthase
VSGPDDRGDFEDPARYGFETRAIRAGQPHDTATGAVTQALHLATTFAQDGVGRPRGYEYARSANPTRAALEACFVSLEGGTHGFAFASGMAAEDAVLRMLRPGDHVVLGNDAYGGTFRLLNRVYAPIGVTWDAVDLTDLAAVRAALRPATRVVWVETPTNPLLTIVDIAALAAVVREHGAVLVVDNTFATPYLQQPHALGAHVVVHSTTKYAGGHSDVVGGMVVVADAALAEPIRFVQNATGAVPSPFDCYLTLRGLKTLAVRMDRHCVNAQRIVELLQGHASVRTVRYPGLSSHPGHHVAARQMRGFGGMVSFTVRGGRAQAIAVAGATRVFTLAESLGAVESLIEHPAVMTHASAAGSPLEVPDDLLRLSVGIEHADDLVADLAAALDRARGA